MKTGIILIIVSLFTIELYAFQAVRFLLKKKRSILKKIVYTVYWLLPILPLIGIAIYPQVEDFLWGRFIRYFIFVSFSINFFPKLLVSIVLLFGDSFSLMRWTVRLLANKRTHKKLAGKPISRSEFLNKAALISAGAPLALMGFGIVKGAHDYRIRRKEVFLKNLPRAFEGIKVAQISDIHTGSFFNKLAVKGGVDMLMAEKPEMIFFTGDLVNNTTAEVRDYVPVFEKIKAPLGVFSVTGNHDYGDYSQWPDEKSKARNFKDLITAHNEMGFDLLMNENRKISVDGESIAVLGNENWGAGRFAKYGDLDKAYAGSEELPVKILLSHDPSHWDAQVRPRYKDIDLMLAGHTHGFQFGVEWGDFKWSPAQYIYKQWAGLYEEGGQQMYVNRGFGFLAYPGRIGIPPEITILELKRG